MLEADYENGEWKNVEIKPYQPLLLEPSLAALHYGQAFLKDKSISRPMMAMPLFFAQ